MLSLFICFTTYTCYKTWVFIHIEQKMFKVKNICWAKKQTKKKPYSVFSSVKEGRSNFTEQKYNKYCLSSVTNTNNYSDEFMFMLWFSHQVVPDSSQPRGAHHASLSLIISWSLPKFVCIYSVMPYSAFNTML